MLYVEMTPDFGSDNGTSNTGSTSPQPQPQPDDPVRSKIHSKTFCKDTMLIRLLNYSSTESDKIGTLGPIGKNRKMFFRIDKSFIAEMDTKV
jgi:hypothetical protein